MPDGYIRVFQPEQYELVDFGDGRRLERFGDYLLDRPCPAAEGLLRAEERTWNLAHTRYLRSHDKQGGWKSSVKMPATWTLTHELAVMELKCTDSGQVGLFAEQAENWDWIAEQTRRAARPLKILNLFAYTGGSTLSAAAAGGHVVHVDAARNLVAWASRNANHSKLSDAPIRWIAEDARTFVQREIRRGNHYDAVILDPPTYGHGPTGEVWQIEKHLTALLQACRDLTAPRRAFVLLTCHSPGYGPAELSACLSDVFFGHCQAGVVGQALTLYTTDRRCLPAGAVARWPQ